MTVVAILAVLVAGGSVLLLRIFSLTMPTAIVGLLLSNLALAVILNVFSG